MGVPNQDIMMVGQLVGQKTAINEFYAYEQLGKLVNGNILSSSKSIAISTFALCGFTNFSSIGIMIGGITSLAPSKRSVVIELSWRALIAAALACFCTAALAGLFY